MNNWVHLQILLFCFIIGLGVSLFLGARSYLKIALVILLLYIPFEIYYTYKLSHTLVPIEATVPKVTIPSNIIAQSKQELRKLGLNQQGSQTITADGSLINLPISSLPSLPINSVMSNLESIKNSSQNLTKEKIFTEQYQKEQFIQETNYALLQNPTPSPNTTTSSNTDIQKTTPTETYTMDNPPFDGLDPKELMSRLNYIYFATSQPGKRINYHDFKTHADQLLDSDGTKLSNDDARLQSYAKGFYPQLTSNQIDVKDCLNEGSGAGSCFQSPQLFYNKARNFNILDKGVNVDNTNLIMREDFSMPSNLEAITSRPLPLDVKSRYPPVLYMNAPHGTMDIPLDNVSNETIARSGKLDISMDTCRNCSLAICKDDYCGLQNSLFI